MPIEGLDFDVAVIGAGVVGCAIARELGGHKLRVALLDTMGDVGDVTSKANTAILHTGFDASPRTMEARLVRRGYQLLSEYAAQTGIPVLKTGALLVAWTPEELAALPGLKRKAEDNGYHHCAILSADEIYADEPYLGSGVLGGLAVPDESIMCTWTTTLALATDAKSRRVELLLNHRVNAIRVGSDYSELLTSRGPIRARWVVNAAGLGSDEIDAMLGHQRFTITPRRGELIVFDKLSIRFVKHIVLPVPSSRGKGVLVSPTIYGNVMLGPTAEDVQDMRATQTSEAGFDFLLDKGRKLLPQLLEEEVTASYAGLRASSDYGDYCIEVDSAQRYLCVAGIRSTGLTASMAIAEYSIALLQEAGLVMVPAVALPPPPRMPNLGEPFARPYQDPERISADPEYGRIICFCERVTRGEIRDALNSAIPPSDLDGLRRRTRAMNGRCQGFFCGAEVAACVATHQRLYPGSDGSRRSESEPTLREAHGAVRREATR
jgi:glycerol-3-phosphate dehydrogenase